MSSRGIFRSNRIVAAFGAHSLGNVVTIADRFLLLPVMLWMWDDEILGAWTIMRSIPAYLSISEMGFASAAGNMITTDVISGNFESANRTYWSTNVLINIISCVALTITALLVAVLPLSEIFNCQILASHVFAICVFLMASYTVAIFRTQLLYALARSVDKHAEVALQIHMTRIAEMVAGLLVMAAGGGVLSVSFTYLLMRLIGIVAIDRWVGKRVSWLETSVGCDKALLRKMIRPAAGFAVLPITQSFQLQGVTMVLAMITTPTVVLAYNAMRTLARLPIMIGLTISRTAWPEMSSAIARNDTSALKAIHRKTCLLSLASNVISLGGLLLLGHSVFRIWTRGRLDFDEGTFVLLSIGAAVTSFSTSTMSILNAAGRHGSSATWWTIASVVSLAICFLFRSHMTPYNASALLLFFEILVCGFILLTVKVFLGQLVNVSRPAPSLSGDATVSTGI